MQNSPIMDNRSLAYGHLKVISDVVISEICFLQISVNTPMLINTSKSPTIKMRKQKNRVCICLKPVR